MKSILFKTLRSILSVLKKIFLVLLAFIKCLFTKDVWKTSFWGGTIAFVFAAVVIFFLNLFFSHDAITNGIVVPVVDDWYLNTYFDKHNSSVEDEGKNVDNIVIISIDEGWFTRGHFADALKRIAKEKPKVIGIDATFSISEGYDSVGNQQLRDAIRYIKEVDSVNIVTAAYVDGNDTVHSFFTKELNLKYGFANQKSFEKYDFFYDDISTPRLATAIASAYNGRHFNTHDEFHVNYRKKNFPTIEHFGDTAEYSFRVDMNVDENTIVLIGQKSPMDVVQMPFVIGTYSHPNQLYGIEVVAYQLNTILAKKSDQDSSHHLPIRTLNPYVNGAIIFILVCLLNLLLLASEKTYRGAISIKPRKCRILSIVLGFIALVIVEYLIICICFWITDKFQYILNITLFFMAVLFIDRGNALFKLLTKKH